MIPTSWMLRLYGLVVTIGYSFLLGSPMMLGWMAAVKIVVAGAGSIIGLAAADLLWRSAKKGTHAQRNRASLSIGVFALTVACLLVATTLYFRKASYSEPEVAIYLAIVLIAAASAAALGSLLARAAKWVD